MSTEPTSVDDPLRLTGTEVGPYRVLHFASLGGFAAIYRAEHESLHFPVALKVLRPEVVPEHARDTLEECFLREAQILGQLRSEHVLRAHHHGKVSCPVDDGLRSYIVVDWLDGQELSRAIEARLARKEPYRIEELLELLEPIALALDAVHSQGLVHRDVNPRNVFLVDMPDGATPRAMLIDFGFAKQAEQSVSGLKIQESTTTLMAGSPDFSAPEHFDRQRFGEPSPKTDLYTFALTLVHAITLEPPLSGDSPRELYEATLDPNKRPTPNRRGASLEHGVDAFFARALAVEPKDRPDGLLKWWNELKAAVQGEPGVEPEILQVAPGEPPPVQREPLAKPADSEMAATGQPGPAFKYEQPYDDVPKARPRRRVLPILIVALFSLGAIGVVGAAALGVTWQSKPKCQPSFADCNQLSDDGCEVNLDEDALHCGRCGTACSSADIDGMCTAGQCRVRKCQNSKLRDCNGEFSDGCETDISTDPKHCGDCESRCGDAGAARAACTAGSCVLTCKPKRADCDLDAGNGCEAELAIDPKNCGACAVGCTDRSCKGGLCEPERVGVFVKAGRVAKSGEELAVWDPAAGQIKLLTSGADPEVLWPTRASLTGLALSKDVVVWAQEKPAMVYALAREPKARPKRLAGPLPTATTLVLTADRRFITFAVGPKKIVSAAFDKTLLNEPGREATCSAAASTYAGNAERQLCCAKGKPLSAFACGDGGCEEKPYSVPCPSELMLAQEHVYFAQGVRIVRIELESGKIERWLSRRRLVTDVALQGEWLYWTEAARELWRARLDAKDPAAAAQRLARGTKPVQFFFGDSAVYWFEPETTDAGESFVLLKNTLPAVP